MEPTSRHGAGITPSDQQPSATLTATEFVNLSEFFLANHPNRASFIAQISEARQLYGDENVRVVVEKQPNNTFTTRLLKRTDINPNQ